jgi:hypothetical protein
MKFLIFSFLYGLKLFLLVFFFSFIIDLFDLILIYALISFSQMVRCISQVFCIVMQYFLKLYELMTIIVLFNGYDIDENAIFYRFSIKF